VRTCTKKIATRGCSCRWDHFVDRPIYFLLLKKAS